MRVSTRLIILGSIVHQSFLVYRGARYFWLALLLTLLAIGVYAWRSKLEVPNGGTWLGYGLGTLGALQILWLMWLGIRKRSYRHVRTTVQGWLSAHVYFGLSLLIIASLHCAFQFGWNIHTFAYAMMCVVIASGIWGVYLYSRLPEIITYNRKGLMRDEMIEQIDDLDRKCLQLAQKLPSHVHRWVSSAVEGTRAGGDTVAQLLNIDYSQMLVQVKGKERVVRNKGQTKLAYLLADEMARSDNSEAIGLTQEILTLLSTKRTLLTRLQRDIGWKAWLDIWLYVHVPFSVGLLAALIAHVLSVFLYW